jgi:hypothetical protein
VKIELNPDWSEFLRLLISHRVKFMIVGGHAVAGHGQPRLTEDLDIFIEASTGNAAALHAALKAFGLGRATPSKADLASYGKIWMIGRKPWRIDILSQIDGVTFEQCWPKRVEAEFEPAPLPVVGRAQLIANKLASGRPKDLADVAMLEDTKPPARPRKRIAKAVKARRRKV